MLLMCDVVRGNNTVAGVNLPLLLPLNLPVETLKVAILCRNPIGQHDSEYDEDDVD